MESSGLFIVDIEHLPTGFGLWPAHWTVSKGKWPDNGEIDIMCVLVSADVL